MEIPLAKHLKPYFKIAEDEAKKSPCSRRQYGAVVIFGDGFYRAATNSRVGRCCDSVFCARTEIGLTNGQRIEVGGEIHAETAVLIRTGPKQEHSHFVLTGFSGNTEFFGKDVWPCHSCAMAIKFAGYSHIYIRNKKGFIYPESISEIIEGREEEWDRGE